MRLKWSPFRNRGGYTAEKTAYVRHRGLHFRLIVGPVHWVGSPSHKCVPVYLSRLDRRAGAPILVAQSGLVPEDEVRAWAESYILSDLEKLALLAEEVTEAKENPKKFTGIRLPTLDGKGFTARDAERVAWEYGKTSGNSSPWFFRVLMARSLLLSLTTCGAIVLVVRHHLSGK